VPGLGAAHAIELPFVFGNLRDQSAVALTGTNPPAALSRRIQAAWAAFALTGNPTAAGDTAWPRYTAASRATMLLSDGPWRLVDDPKGDDRQILREMYDVETR
jgi:para-nitrobenzyl esterase